MSTHNTKTPADPEAAHIDPAKVMPPDRRPPPPTAERDRLRDIIIVIVTYPLTPTEKTDKLAWKKPWLEFVSLLLKVVLAIYAIYEAVSK